MDAPHYHLTGVVRTKEELLEDFEGPLDVILLLLGKNKIEISDISITAILEQYLEYLDQMKRMDMEIASEFILMASHLMQIKTKMLLSYSERTQAQSEMDELMESLRMRQRATAKEKLSAALTELESRNEQFLGRFTKLPEPYTPDGTYRYQHSPDDLLRAVQTISERTERRMPPPVSAFSGVVGRSPYSVSKKAAELLRLLVVTGVEKLKALYRKCTSKSELVAAFLAVLDLVRNNCVSIEGAEADLSVRFEKMPDIASETNPNEGVS